MVNSPEPKAFYFYGEGGITLRIPMITFSDDDWVYNHLHLERYEKVPLPFSEGDWIPREVYWDLLTPLILWTTWS